MAYMLSNDCTKNYWNRTIIVKDIVEGWVVYFCNIVCIPGCRESPICHCNVNSIINSCKGVSKHSTDRRFIKTDSSTCNLWLCMFCFIGIVSRVLRILRCLLNAHVSMSTKRFWHATADILPIYLCSTTANRVHQAAAWSWIMIWALQHAFSEQF